MKHVIPVVVETEDDCPRSAAVRFVNERLMAGPNERLVVAFGGVPNNCRCHVVVTKARVQE